MKTFSFPYTERQRQMVEHRARILWIGTATKTGKSAASYCWLIEGLLKGECGCFAGPWFFRSKRAFDECKVLLEPWIRSKQVRCNEARLQISTANAYIDFVSADNSNGLYGGNYHRLILDESSRMPEAIYGGALTVISATGGKLRCLFNLELGTRNWSIRNLLRVQRLSPEERLASSEDFLTFPTDERLVDPALVQMLRNKMPEPLWRALYLAEIPESDSSLFRNLDKIFVGRELEGPVPGRQYILAADVARKKDWSVLTVIDDEGHVVSMDRFNQVSWSLQVERAKLLYETFGCRKAICDGTGVDDVVAEKFEDAGMNVEAFIFTVPSRRLLIEELVMACDNSEITVPATEKFQVYRSELESMEYQLDGQSIKYAVPAGLHDDALFSLALATHAFRGAKGAVLGLLEFAKKIGRDIAAGIRDTFGELVNKPVPQSMPGPAVKAKPVVTQVNNYQEQLAAMAKTCPNCASTAVQLLGSPGNVHCCQCGSDFNLAGEITRNPVETIIVGVNCCSNPLPQSIAGSTRCVSCGSQTAPPRLAAATFKDLRRRWPVNDFMLRGPD
jgi:hypothetical protein